MPSAERKARVTSLPTTTSRNGPKGLGAGRPKRPVKNSAAARGSFEWTMVWFSLTAMALRRGTGREEREELAPRLWPVGPEVGLRILQVRAALARDAVAGCVFLDVGGGEAVDPGGVAAEDPGAQLGGDFGVAVFLAQGGRDLKGAEGLDLVLGRAVPDGVGAPEDVVGAAVLDELADPMRRLVRVAHQEAPGAAELGVYVRARGNVVFLQRGDQGVDAVVAGRVSLLRNAGDEAGVVDEEVDVGKALGDDADVAALAVLVGAVAEGQALVHGDVLHPELARFFYKADADIVAEEEAFALRTPLGVGLPGGHAPFLLQLVHAFQVSRLVRVDAAVQQQPVRALELLDYAAHGVGGLDGDGLGVASRRDEGEHHDVGVAVHEDVLDEHLGALCISFRGVDKVALHVEDEFVLRRPDLRAREPLVERGVLGQIEEAAAAAGRGVRGVEREQRAGGAAGGNQEAAAGEIDLLREGGSRFVRQPVRLEVSGRERHGRELAIGGRVELDRQASAFGVDTVFHGGSPL